MTPPSHNLRVSKTLAVWQTYLQETETKEAAIESNWVDRGVEGIQEIFSGRSPREVRLENSRREHALFAAVKLRIESGQTSSLKQALESLSTDGEPEIRERAQFYLNPQSPKTLSKLVVSRLMSPDETFLRETFQTIESHAECPATALGIYQLFASLPAYREKAEEHLNAFRGKAGLGRSIEKAVYGINPLRVGFDILLMWASAGVGNLAKAAYLARYAPAARTTAQVGLAAFAVESGAETATLGTLNAGRALVTQDPKKVDVAKIYSRAATMVPITKGFGKLGQAFLPSSAMVHHGAGFSGMVTSTQVYEGVTGEEYPGGFNEALAHDIIGYFSFAAAGRGIRVALKSEKAMPKEVFVLDGASVDGKAIEVGPAFVPEIVEINGVKMARIPAGKFRMGTEDRRDAQPREVELSEYYIAQNLVTNREFDLYCKEYQDHPYAIFGWKNGKFEVLRRYGPDGPRALSISEEAADRGTKISQQGNEFFYMGMESDLMKDVAGKEIGFRDLFIARAVPKSRDLPAEFSDPEQPAVSVTWNEAFGYAQWKGMELPTEAQWEKAARGPEGHEYGTATGELTKELAHYNAKAPAKVGSYPPNGYGVCDMAGNVWQWVRDWYQNSYQGLPHKDPVGPEAGQWRVLRGGFYFSTDPDVLSAAYRLNIYPGRRSDIIGFRCVARPQD
ncbi:MAG: SUMF1/EgtB/PvdO family nonheme iron enzyme [bacterium]